jgi:hypothetical protein
MFAAAVTTHAAIATMHTAIGMYNAFCASHPLVVHAYNAYSAHGAVNKAVNWAEAEMLLRSIENSYEALKHTQPAKQGHPEWATQTGYFDQRRRPFPALRAVIAAQREAIRSKRQDMFMLAMEEFLSSSQDIMGELQSYL